MPLINCPECDRQVSTEAQTCPACGYPVAAKLAASQPVAAVPADELLREIRPSWWHFFWHLFFFWLIVPLIIALCRRAATILRIYANRITLERGLFSKCYQDFIPRDIRSIDWIRVSCSGSSALGILPSPRRPPWKRRRRLKASRIHRACAS